MEKAEFRTLVTKLRRNARDQRRLAGQMQKVSAMEAFKMALGEAYAYDRAATWIEEILNKPKE